MTLLAKSRNDKQNVTARTLKEHIDDCLIIFTFLKVAFPKAAEVSGLGEKFWDILRACIIYHDLGKAHREFQKLLNGQPNDWCFQRHELFSLPFVSALVGYDKDILHLIQLAVAGHHKDFQMLRNALNYYQGEAFGMLELIESTETFEDAFNRNVDINGVVNLLHEYKVEMDGIQARPVHALIHLYNKNPYRYGNPHYFSLMLLFGALKWCDHLGSAMVTDFKVLKDDDFSFLVSFNKGLQTRKFNLYDHQKTASLSLTNLLLTAPTGSGKTESAFFWLQNQLKIHGQGRVFYVLPFTASINAMYERLSADMGGNEGKIGMLHGKLNDYLNNFFEDLQYSLTAKKESIANIREKFKSIVTPVKVTTPFQLLKHLFGLKGYEQGLFEMAGSYLIFDEIHAYSPEIFAQIKVLLEFATRHLGVKVMIMTATMPRFLLVELENSIGKFETIKASKKLYDDFKRHRVVLIDGLLMDGLEHITLCLQKGMKVLVVCNTVKSAQRVFQDLKKYVSQEEAVLLHGSFSGVDRAKKESDLKSPSVKLLVGTQAIEVSLDIDYDIIFTEPAPIDALVQRFGRVNRKRTKGICNCIVFKEGNDDDKYIYHPSTIIKTISALQEIIKQDNGVIDESVLQDSIDYVYSEWNEEDKRKFDDQERYLWEALHLLFPMFKNKHTEEDFYKRFDGVKVLPQCNKKTYERFLNDFDFISAESQKVQISKRKFISWIKSENIKKEVFAFSKANKINIEPYFITNKVYSPIFGLIPDEEEGWETTELF